MGRLRISPFTWLILGAVVVAFMWPVQGEAAVWFGRLTTAGVAVLFFVHGAALPREAVIGGLTQWRLHLFIFSITFIVFPLLVLPLAPLGRVWLPADLVLGFLYLAALPSAVSSSIAFTAIARGNVPAAVCSSASSAARSSTAPPHPIAPRAAPPRRSAASAVRSRAAISTSRRRSRSRRGFACRSSYRRTCASLRPTR